ncbi:hypothetical protein [Amycolatopsis sp. CA-126428]|uniref:hypothetical protein n=1 Tax=Amycolatopsis sp. CA-126428 TaxID=2073158 RepID=UPI0011B0739D|nr:hypothetical protein [Amycolatopsis sp. CA-126428]
MSNRYVEYMPIKDIQAATRNPKEHDTAGISRSIGHFGLAELPLVDERTGRLVAGHGRYLQLRAWAEEGRAAPEGVQVDEDGRWLMPVIRGWASRSDDDAEAYLIASNQLTVKGGWDDRMLAEVLHDLGEAQMLDLTGYDADDLAALEDALTADDDEEGEPGEGDPPDKGEALRLAGVTVGEPDYETATGQIWDLGRHKLVVADVHTGWPLWTPLLGEDDLFWPYPTMLAPFAQKAEEHRVVMVQPLPYLAGWLLTKWKRITGNDPVLSTPAETGRAA